MTVNLQPGDKVKILKFPTGAYIGSVGIVEDINYAWTCPVTVYLGNLRTLDGQVIRNLVNFYESDLEKIE